MIRPRLAALMLLVPLAACGGGEEAPSPDSRSETLSTARLDTVRGVVAVVGAEPMRRVVLRRDTRPPELYLTGAAAASLAGLSGAQVEVEGHLADSTDPHMEVYGFAVRAVEGVSAVDGVLLREGDQLVLMTADGRRLAISRPPPALRQLVGSRVWLAGPLDRTPAAFGVIEPRR